MLKSIYSTLISIPCLTILSSFLVSEPVLALSDISTHWGKAEIRTLVEMGVVSGYPNNEFRPNKTISRAEFASLLSNGNKYFNLPNKRSSINFSDVSSKDWFARQVQAVVRTGFMSGRSTTTFAPKANVKRQEVFVALGSGLGYSGSSSSLNRYTDGSTRENWGLNSLYGAISQNIVDTDANPNKLLRPSKPATRAEVAVAIFNALKSKNLIRKFPPTSLGGAVVDEIKGKADYISSKGQDVARKGNKLIVRDQKLKTLSQSTGKLGLLNTASQKLGVAISIRSNSTYGFPRRVNGNNTLGFTPSQGRSRSHFIIYKPGKGVRISLQGFKSLEKQILVAENDVSTVNIEYCTASAEDQGWNFAVRQTKGTIQPDIFDEDQPCKKALRQCEKLNSGNSSCSIIDMGLKENVDPSKNLTVAIQSGAREIKREEVKVTELANWSNTLNTQNYNSTYTSSLLDTEEFLIVPTKSNQPTVVVLGDDIPILSKLSSGSAIVVLAGEIKVISGDVKLNTQTLGVQTSCLLDQPISQPIGSLKQLPPKQRIAQGYALPACSTAEFYQLDQLFNNPDYPVESQDNRNQLIAEIGDFFEIRQSGNDSSGWSSTFADDIRGFNQAVETGFEVTIPSGR